MRKSIMDYINEMPDEYLVNMIQYSPNLFEGLCLYISIIKHTEEKTIWLN